MKEDKATPQPYREPEFCPECGGNLIKGDGGRFGDVYCLRCQVAIQAPRDRFKSYEYGTEKNPLRS